MSSAPHGQATTATARGAAAVPVLVGAVGGLAWAAALRGLMVQVAGPGSAVEWGGTVGGILLPGLVAGALVGWAGHLRRTGHPHRGWLALAPLAFVVATPGVLVSVLTDGGIGGGAIALPLCGIAGGWALGGRGPVAGRVAAGALPVAGAVGWAVGAPAIAPALAVTTARGAWVAVLFAALLAVLSLACAVPHRPAGGPLVPGARAAAVTGAVGGLAWAAGLRSLMVEIADPGTSSVSWAGTFAGILLPGLVVGALLARAPHRRGPSRLRGVRGRAGIGVVAGGAAAAVALAGGLGGGALAVVVCGLAGGYALAGRGRPAARVTAGLLPVVVVVAWSVATAVVGLDEPGTGARGAWVAVLLASHLAVLAAACALPYRRADDGVAAVR
ncbi:hypothetical protein [Pseudonocardia oceani]|uniref:Integral membrane protein n=6 Tax=Pseudonocardia oceani TaxID=2792013 RepID=A0ABS6U3Z1_9PSEU|nr:hypothetical protein [Pseudonocardia oceani]MBW0126918.1 hypothetical protein [Pseudonocardia oceani]